jgi:hypothetical protein
MGRSAGLFRLSRMRMNDKNARMKPRIAFREREK